MTNRPTVELSGDEALMLFRVLNELVVSLDQISSREAGGEDPEGKYLSGYFEEDGATLRLVKARRAINDAVERVYGEDTMETLGEQIVYWADLHPDL